MNRHLDIFNLSQITVSRSKKELKLQGEHQRHLVSPLLLGDYVPVHRDPVELIKMTEANMIPELLPLRHQRMTASLFAFYRGTADLMEDDLKSQNQSMISTIICGDAHINNYGFYASPEHKLLFDLNDFDEARIGNWESDLKRLLVSVLLAGSENNFDDDQLKDLCRRVAKVYRRAIKYSYHQSLPSRFYSSYEIHDMMDQLHEAYNLTQSSHLAHILQKIMVKSSKSNSETIVEKKTIQDKYGRRHFIENAPRAKHVDERTYTEIVNGFYKYRNQLPADVKILLANYSIIDIIRYSVGVGSFWTRCFLLLLRGNDGTHIVLQLKESLPLRYNLLRLTVDDVIRRTVNAGNRIVTAQKILQSASDPFLGSTSFGHRSYYVRQFRDMKESIDVSKLDWDGFALYSEICSFLLAKAHFQSPTAPMIRGYLKGQKQLDSALADWAIHYAQQVKEDYHTFLDALDPQTGLLN